MRVFSADDICGESTLYCCVRVDNKAIGYRERTALVQMLQSQRRLTAEQQTAESCGNGILPSAVAAAAAAEVERSRGSTYTTKANCIT